MAKTRKKLTKSDIIDRLCTKLDDPRSEVSRIVDLFLREIVEVVGYEGTTISLLNFGTFRYKSPKKYDRYDINEKELVTHRIKPRIQFECSSNITTKIEGHEEVEVEI